MAFKESATIYNKFFNPTTRSDDYQRTIIHGIHWDETEAINRVASGIADVDKVVVVIPFRADASREFLAPDEFDKEEVKLDYFTLSPGDRIVKGVKDFEVTGKISDLDRMYDAHIILSVDTKDFGSPRMHHWEVGAK